MKLFRTSIILLSAGLMLLAACEKGPNGYTVDKDAVVLEAYGPNPVLRGSDLKFVGQNLDRITSVVLPVDMEIPSSEFKDAILMAKKAYELGIDALIVQDVGLAQVLMKLFPDLPIHASTQMTVHNLEGVQKLEKLGYSRAVLSRELSIQEIEYICSNSNIEIETFIHGALCISYSGQCLFSSMVGGRSRKSW